MTVERSDFAEIEKLLREILGELRRAAWATSALPPVGQSCEHQWVSDTGGNRCVKCGMRTNVSF